MASDAHAGAAERRTAFIATVAVLAFLGIGAATLPFVSRFRLQYTSLFYEQFAAIEPAALIVVAMFALAVLFMARRRSPVDVTEPTRQRERGTHMRTGVVLVAIAVFACALLGTDLVFHRFFLADDEYAAWFQAVIFSHGQTTATVSTEWCRWIAALTPTSIAANGCVWKLTFLPVHSLIRAGFIALHIDRLGGPTTAALSIILVAAIARRAWPERPARAWLAVAALAASTQFLFMSMTMWAMPTHLLFALLWLLLYVEDRAWSIIALPWVGFIALGVHSPVPHALLVPPFLLRYVRDRRWGVVAYVAAVYVVALMFWTRQLSGPPSIDSHVGMVALASPGATAELATHVVGLPSQLQSVTAAMHLALLFTWNTPLLLICILSALLSWNRLDTFGKDLGLSLILVLAVRVVDPGGSASQGEGWGYRFAYAALGNCVLLGACGMEILIEALGRRRAAGLAMASLAVTLLVQIPMRAIQVERIIRPYYLASAWMAQLPQTIVLLPADQVRWGRQLVRNDPFLLRGNLIMAQRDLGPHGVDDVQRLYPGRTHLVTPQELTRFGLERAGLHVGSVTIMP